MRKFKFPALVLTPLVFALTLAPALHAAVLTWDPAGGGPGSDGSGAWLGSGEWWDGGANVTWTSGDDAIIGSGGAGGSITLASPTVINSLTMEAFTGVYDLGTNGQTMTLDSITSNSDSQTTFQSQIDNGGSDLVIDGTGTITDRSLANVRFVRDISGSGGIVKNGPGVAWIQYTGSLSYTGDTTINGGVLRFQNNSFISGSPGNLTLNGGVAEAYWGETFTRTLGSGPGQVQILGGASGFSQHGSTALTIRLNNNASSVVTWGSAFFNPTTLVLQTIYSNSGTVSWENPIDLNGADRTIEVNQGATQSNTRAILRGTISNSGGSPAGLIKTGEGILILQPNNGSDYTYDGDMVIQNGVVQFGNNFNNTWNAESLPSTANLEINDGIAAGFWVFERALGTGAGEVQLTGGRAGFSFLQGDRPDLNFGNASAEVQWGSATFDPSILVLNDSIGGGSATIDFENALDLNGADRTVETGVAGGNGTTSGDAWGRVLGAGAIFTDDIRNTDAGNTAGIIKTGPGKLGFAGVNTFDGDITVDEGSVFFDRISAMPGTTDVSLANGTEIIVTVGGPDSWTTGTSGVGTYGGLLAGDGGSGTATVTYAGDHTIGMNLDGVSETYAGNIADGPSGTTSLSFYSNSNNGTITLSGNNTFTGDLFINTGATVELDSANAMGSGNIDFGGGTLQLTGNTSDISGQIRNSTSTINVNTNGIDEIWAGNINNSNTSGLTKTGAGTLTLTGNNNFGGSVTVNGGTLEAASNTALANRSVTINAAGTLLADGASSLGNGNLTPRGTLHIQQDGGATVTNQINNINRNVDPVIILDRQTAGAADSWVFTNAQLRVGQNSSVTFQQGANVTSDTTQLDIQSGIQITEGNQDQEFTYIADTVNVLVNGFSDNGRRRTIVLDGSSTGNTIYGDMIQAGSNTSNIIKRGSGTWNITSTGNNYTGTVDVEQGTLLVDGSLTTVSSITVDTGASLGGSGTIGAPTTISGIHAPGSSPGIQTFEDDLTYSGGASEVQWELIGNTITNAANPNANFDTVEITSGGNLDFAGATAFDLVFNDADSSVDWTNSFWLSSYLGTGGWLLYDVDGTTTGFGNLSLNVENWQDSLGQNFNSVLALSSFSLHQDGDDVYLNYTYVIPEPASLMLLAAGVTCIGLRRRRR